MLKKTISRKNPAFTPPTCPLTRLQVVEVWLQVMTFRCHNVLSGIGKNSADTFPRLDFSYKLPDTFCWLKILKKCSCTFHNSELHQLSLKIEVFVAACASC